MESINLPLLCKNPHCDKMSDHIYPIICIREGLNKSFLDFSDHTNPCAAEPLNLFRGSLDLDIRNKKT